MNGLMQVFGMPSDGNNVWLVEGLRKQATSCPRRRDDPTEHADAGRQATITGQTDAGKQCLDQLNV